MRREKCILKRKTDRREIYGKTPKLAMTPYTELIYIKTERAEEQEPWTRRHAGGDRQQCGPHRRATHGQKAGNGEETRQEGDFCFEKKQSEPNRSLCACFSLRGLQRGGCEKQVVRESVSRKHPSRNSSGILSVERGA